MTIHRPAGGYHQRLQLHGAIYRPDSFVLMLRYCANLKAIRYESTTLNGIVADKSHRVIVAKETTLLSLVYNSATNMSAVFVWDFKFKNRQLDRKTFEIDKWVSLEFPARQ